MEKTCCVLAIAVMTMTVLNINAEVPPEKRFTSVNAGEWGFQDPEFRGDYRFTDVNMLVFINRTVNAFELAIYFGFEETYHIVVWSANRNRLVGENAYVQFGADGNLVLIDHDNTLVWETKTANKGVVDIRTQPNGNLVLMDINNNTVWQSFDHPTDTLLLGQSLAINKKLVSRVSNTDPSEGAYSMQIHRGGVALYYSSLPYWIRSTVKGQSDVRFLSQGCKRNSLERITLTETSHALRLTMDLLHKNGTACGALEEDIVMSEPDPNMVSAFLRLDPDGNVRVHRFQQNFDLFEFVYTYQLFGHSESNCGSPGHCLRDPVENDCGLPERCGQVGLCSNSTCLSCDGALGCLFPSPPPCGAGYNESGVDFHAIVGAEHYSLRYVVKRAKVGLRSCRKACARDCKCAAFFYWKESSLCFFAPNVATLNHNVSLSHLAYIKIPHS